MGILAKFGKRLWRFLLRWFGYLLGLGVILILLGIGAFFLFKSSLVDFAGHQIKKYGIEAQSMDISPLGDVHLKNVRIPFRDGGVLTADAFSGRPPLPGLGGTASLYNVVLQKGGIRVAMPELYLEGLSLAGKDPAFSSRSLQMLMRVGASSIIIPVMNVSLEGEKAGEATLHDVKLTALGGGRIGNIVIGEMSSILRLAPGAEQSTWRSGGFSVKNVDIGSAYRVLSGLAGAEGGSVPVTGRLSLQDVRADMIGLEGKTYRVAVGEVNSNGLALKQAETPLLAVFKTLLADDGKSRASPADLVLLALKNTEIDAAVKNVMIDTPQLKVGFSAFEVKPGEWRQRLPQALHIVLRGMRVDTAQLAGESARFLQDVGYDTLNMSVVFDIFYDEATKNLILRDIAFNGGRIGSASVNGVVGNFGKEFFSGGKDEMIAALHDAKLVRLDMTMFDDGMIDRLIEWETTQINISKEELKGYLELFVTQSAVSLLKHHPDAGTISGALGAFIRDSGNLQIHVAAKRAGGVRLSDIFAGENDIRPAGSDAVVPREEVRESASVTEGNDLSKVLEQFELSVTR